MLGKDYHVQSKRRYWEVDHGLLVHFESKSWNPADLKRLLRTQMGHHAVHLVKRCSTRKDQGTITATSALTARRILSVILDDPFFRRFLHPFNVKILQGREEQVWWDNYFNTLISNHNDEAVVPQNQHTSSNGRAHHASIYNRTTPTQERVVPQPQPLERIVPIPIHHALWRFVEDEESMSAREITRGVEHMSFD